MNCPSNPLDGLSIAKIDKKAITGQSKMGKRINMFRILNQFGKDFNPESTSIFFCSLQK